MFGNDYNKFIRQYFILPFAAYIIFVINHGSRCGGDSSRVCYSWNKTGREDCIQHEFRICALLLKYFFGIRSKKYLFVFVLQCVGN